MQHLMIGAIGTHQTAWTRATLDWEALIILPTLASAVDLVSQVYDFQVHPYSLWMQATSTDRNAFCQSQLPFRFAVESFSQSLAAVLARINLLEARLPLLANITEEHGQGDRWRSHKYTFREYLQALGATALELEQPCTTAVLAFNQSLLTYCLTQPPESSAALLGMIESLYVGISHQIAKILQQRHWAVPGQQSHYTAHEVLDTEHARDLLQLAEPAWPERRSRIQVAQGLLLGAYYFWSLYRDLQPMV